MSNKDIHALLMQFQIYWNEALNGNHKHSQQLRNLALQIEKLAQDPLIRASMNPTEQIFYKNAMIIANVK